MKLSCKHVNRKRDFEIFAAYPLGFRFSVDESADESRTAKRGRSLASAGHGRRKLTRPP